MAKHSEDWIPFHGWDSDDWGQAGMVVGGVALGALTGGLGWGATAAAIGTGAALGGALGLGKAMEDQATEETERKTTKALRAQEAEAMENERLRKQSLLAAQNTMSAREAMARNVNAAIRNMYSPKTKSNNPAPYMLGGEEEKLG